MHVTVNWIILQEMRGRRKDEKEREKNINVKYDVYTLGQQEKRAHVPHAPCTS